jgi:hypothetical protein
LFAQNATHLILHRKFNMRYWQHGETGRLLKVQADVPLNPNNWIEITEDQYIEAERINEDDDKTPDSTTIVVQ